MNGPALDDARYDTLAACIRSYGSAVVAYSGGVDSTLVAVVAHRELGARALAVTGISASLSGSEREQAKRLAQDLELPHRCVDTDELARPGYRANAGDRCFHCKSELFEQLRTLAQREGFAHVLSGDNLDDVQPGGHRPGMRAAEAWSVQKPLIESGLGKEDVRALAKLLNIPNHAKVASPCLASRVPHGVAVDREVLAKIERAEAAVRGLGFSQFRVRHHGDVARLELGGTELERALAERTALVRGVKAAGYQWVTLDLAGFRSGSLNVVLRGETIQS